MIIGLTGLAGAGKSTAAEYLVEAHGFERRNFAGPLKKMLRTLNPIIGYPPMAFGFDKYKPYFYLNDLFDLEERWLKDGGLPIEQAEGRIKEGSWGAEYRRLLQVLGTDCIRAVDPDFWVKAAMKDLDPAKDYVFDDVRFPNESTAIYLAQGGRLINIFRPGVQRGEHESEKYAGLMGETYVIENDGDMSWLHTQLADLLEAERV